MNNITQKPAIGRRTSTYLAFPRSSIPGLQATQNSSLKMFQLVIRHLSRPLRVTWTSSLPSCLTLEAISFTLWRAQNISPIHLELSLETFLQKAPKVQICLFCYLMNSSTNISSGQFECTSIKISCGF